MKTIAKFNDIQVNVIGSNCVEVAKVNVSIGMTLKLFAEADKTLKQNCEDAINFFNQLAK